MEYKLAKQLKEAKFPFVFRESKLGDDTYNYPSLEELIDACGNKFDCLERNRKNSWEAWNGKQGEESRNSFGETPNIAVAKLW